VVPEAVVAPPPPLAQVAPPPVAQVAPPPAPVPAPPPVKPAVVEPTVAPVVEAKAPGEPPPPPRPEPAPPPKKGCPHCGSLGSYNLHSRSPLGILMMLFGTFGGLTALAFVEKDWRYGLAAGTGFVAALIGAFLKRWTVICAQCERTLY
jgi:hypothetical protein